MNADGDELRIVIEKKLNNLLMTVRLTLMLRVGLNLKSTLQMYTPPSDSLTLSNVSLAGSSWKRKNARPPNTFSLAQCTPCSRSRSRESNLNDN